MQIDVVKYFLVILTGFLVDFIIYSVLVYNGIFPVIAIVPAFFVGCGVNTILLRRYVFTNTRFGMFKDMYLSFMSSGSVLFLGAILIFLFINKIGMNPYAAKLITNIITFCINYSIRKRFFQITR